MGSLDAHVVSRGCFLCAGEVWSARLFDFITLSPAGALTFAGSFFFKQNEGRYASSAVKALRIVCSSAGRWSIPSAWAGGVTPPAAPPHLLILATAQNNKK